MTQIEYIGFTYISRQRQLSQRLDLVLRRDVLRAYLDQLAKI
jgi:hypothetical protein